MKTATTMGEVASSSYLIVILSVVGIFMVATAILVAWPALAYIGSKLF